MRKIWVIAWNSLVRTARDKRALVMLVLMPLILVVILGSALKGMMGDGKINPFKVLVVNADQPQLPAYHFGKVLVEDVLGSEEASRVIRISQVDDLDRAKADVAAGKAVAAVYVGPTFTADVLAGRPAAVQLFSDPGEPTKADIVGQVVQGFADAVSFGALAARSLGPEQATRLLAAPNALFDRSALPQVRETASGARSVSAIQYYAAAMAVMFMVMTAFTRARDVLQERQQGTLARMLASPTGSGAIIAGQMAGSVVVLLAQFLVLLIGTRLLFGVHWGPWLPVLLLGAVFSLAATGLGTAAAGLLNDPKAADAAVGIVGNVFAALSGSMFPLYIFPEGLRTVAKFTPNYWAMQGFLDLMAGVGAASLRLPVAILLAMGLAAGVVGAWRLAVKEV